MKDNKKEYVYGGYECPQKYDRYEKEIGIKHWLLSHKPLMLGISVIIIAILSYLIFFCF